MIEHKTKHSNPHSTGRLMLAAKMKDFGKMKICEVNKVSGIDSPSAGEFIRYTDKEDSIVEMIRSFN